MTRATRPVIQRFAYLLLTLAFVLTGIDPAPAAQSGLQTAPSSTAFQGKQIMLAQTYTLQGKGGGRHPTPQPTPTPPPGGKKPPSGGGGISIGIDIIGIINNPPYNPPRRVPPKKVYPKPKKTYAKPKPKPKPKAVKTARPRPPQRPAGPLAIQPIPQFIPDQVTVLIQGQPDSVDDALAQSFNLTKLSSSPITLLDGHLVTYRVPQGRPLPQVIAALRADPRVAVAQPNNIYLTVQQKSRPAGHSAQYAFAKLALNSAHEIAQGRGVPVAVIDTGVDGSHPALAKVISGSFDAVGDGKAEPQDHGTSIAGLISGRGKVTGVAPAANLLAVRAFYMHPEYKRPVTSSDILIRAFEWAFTSKARVFNMSFAGPYDPLVQAALTSAHDKGVILVAAAGNGGPKAPPAYPAAYDNVIAITALDQKDKLYAHANHGRYLTAAAPGVDVLVPVLKKGYRYSSGTSMAAAHVSGLVALLLESQPDASAASVLDAIRTTAHDLGPKGHDVQFGAGRADAHASLMSLSGAEVRLTSGQ